MTVAAFAPSLSAAGGTYLPIENHGVIGDLRSAALVGRDGTIDWFCPLRFDAPSVFAAILDADHGGLFRISPDGDGWLKPPSRLQVTEFAKTLRAHRSSSESRL
jgi:GH15 family glucan-1,4-alpha-glucosidase